MRRWSPSNRVFKNVEELRLVLHEWKNRRNRSWLIERHGFRSPQQARFDLERKAA